MSLWRVIINRNCDCHDMLYCFHGPLINTAVEADSREQLEGLIPMAIQWRYDVWIEEQKAQSLDELIKDIEELDT